MKTSQSTRRRSEGCPVDLRPSCPFFRVDWRWQRAEWRLRTKSRRGERGDDEWVLRAIRAQRWLRRGKPDKDPDVVQVQSQLLLNHWTRAELEARILANQSISQISATMGLSQEVITVFEALFFDVRRRLGAQDWVLFSLLGSRMFRPQKPEDVTLAWRVLGYQFGPAMVDALVNGADRHNLETIGMPAYWAPSSRLSKELQLLLLSQSISDVGRAASGPLNRLVDLGLCRQLPHYDPPPKDGSLDMSGEYSWVGKNDGIRAAMPLRIYAADAA